MEENPFDKRREENPQGVIDDLLEQSKRQSKTIRQAHKWIDEVDALRLDENEMTILEGEIPSSIRKKLLTKWPERPKRPTDKGKK